MPLAIPNPCDWKVALILLFLRGGATIEGVAIAVSLGAGIYGIGLLAFASLHATSTARERIGLVVKFALPSLKTVLLCVTLFTGLRPRLEPYADGWQISALLCGLFVLFYVAMARKLKPRTGVVAMLRDSSWPFARMLAGVWDRD